MPRSAPRSVRKGVFGRDPEAYDRARLRYPPRVYEILTKRCGLRPGSVVFEIGPGTGIATRELLRLGADPITLIEPDGRLVRFLLRSLAPVADRIQVTHAPFERATETFDLGVAATSFHWLPERQALRRVARALKPGGWWASWNNHHGEPVRASRFREALRPLYRRISRGRSRGGPTPAALEREQGRHLASLASVDRFERISREDIRWSVRLDSGQVQALWGTFSDIVTLPPPTRRWFLRELGVVVDEQFGGRVEVPIYTPMYTARRR